MVVLYQYFTINTKNNSEEIVINFQNNYYIHSFFKLRGYSDFMNKISKKDIDDFMEAVNESINMTPSRYSKYFNINHGVIKDKDSGNFNILDNFELIFNDLYDAIETLEPVDINNPGYIEYSYRND